MRFGTTPERDLCRSGSARLPTAFGRFRITVYRDRELKEHLAVYMGDLGGPPPLVRIHSECLTGDVFGSVRCDCGEQLETALRDIAEEGRGLLLYLRQEGRGIGLDNKIRAYALQDQGMDTVDANLHLGFPADGRSYTHAAAILEDLGVRSIRLATNNPDKVKALEACGIEVVERVRFEIEARPENFAYLQTKALKMGHLVSPLPLVETEPGKVAGADSARELALSRASGNGNGAGHRILERVRERLETASPRIARSGAPSVTLSYAQSLDGSIAARPGEPLQLSNSQTQALTHELRSLHDAILVGINTVLSDDPRLTVRLVEGRNPQPVVLDTRLRLPLDARLLSPPCVPPIVATLEGADSVREKRLVDAGATVIHVPAEPGGLIDLPSLLVRLGAMGIGSVMVEGGAQVITGFLASGLLDRMIVTIAPKFVGGLKAVKSSPPEAKVPVPACLANVSYESIGGDLVVYADVDRHSSGDSTRGRGEASVEIEPAGGSSPKNGSRRHSTGTA